MGDAAEAAGLRRERIGAVEVLTLDRPEVRNALDGALIGALRTALDTAAADDGVRCLVLTGAGDRAFCAGMDLKEFAAGGSPGNASGLDGPGPLIPWDHPKPIVAAVNGAAVAGGFELLLSCDVIVAAEHATFAMAEVRRGLLPGGGGTALAARIPLSIALEVVLAGDPIDARRAEAVGLVNRVVPADRVVDEALAVAARIAANGPLAVATAKRLVWRGATGGATSAFPDSDDIRRIYDSADAKEGALAFVEKREPKWTGR